MHAPVEGSPTGTRLPVESRVFAGSEWLGEALCTRRLAGNGFFLGRGHSRQKEVSPGKERNLLQHPLHAAVRRWNKFHRWWRPELHRLSAGAGQESRRHLECRSFKQNGGPLHFGRLFPVWDLLPALAALSEFSGEAGAPNTRGFRMLGWDADLRAEPPVTGARRSYCRDRCVAVWSAATEV
jgi:hypothetical protein